MAEARHIDERVASLEVTVKSVAESVQSLAHTVSEGFAQGRRDRETSREAAERGMRDVQTELSRERESRKPQYQTHAAWAGVVLTIVFGAWSLTSKGYDRDVQRIETSISELQNTRIEASYQRGITEGKFSERGAVIEEIKHRVSLLEQQEKK